MRHLKKIKKFLRRRASRECFPWAPLWLKTTLSTHPAHESFSKHTALAHANNNIIDFYNRVTQ